MLNIFSWIKNRFSAKGLENKLNANIGDIILLRNDEDNLEVCGYLIKKSKKKVTLSLFKDYSGNFTRKQKKDLEEPYKLKRFDEYEVMQNTRWEKMRVPGINQGDVLNLKNERAEIVGFVHHYNSALKISLTSPFNNPEDSSLINFVHVSGNDGDYIRTTRHFDKYRVLKRANTVDLDYIIKDGTL